MKRLLAFLFIAVLAFSLFPNKESKLFDNVSIDRVCLVANCELNLEDKIVSGNQFYYKMNRLQAKQEFNQNRKNIDGVVLYFDGTKKLNDIIDYYKISYYRGESVDNYDIYYGYSSYFNESYNLNGKRQNVQIAKLDNEIIVGFPAILTGF